MGNMYKCPECGANMKPKGELDELGRASILQCPKCKNIELLERHSNYWFRLEYPQTFNPDNRNVGSSFFGRTVVHLSCLSAFSSARISSVVKILPYNISMP